MRTRNYLSWSQMDSFLKGRYSQDYIWGKFEGNKYTEFGQEVHSQLEGEADNDFMQQVKLFLPQYPLKELEIKQEVEGVPMLGVFDGLDMDNKVFGDYKTSKNEWTQRMADTNGQFTFYALILWKKYNWLPEKINVHWLETTEENGYLELTGNVQTITTKRSKEDLISFFGRVQKSWQGIEELCTKEMQFLF